MDSAHSQNSNIKPAPVPSAPAPSSNITEVEAEVESLESDYEFPMIPPDRRLSWLGWSVALGVFLVNKKIGLIFIVLLLVFGKFPTLNLKNISGQAGKLYKKLRS